MVWNPMQNYVGCDTINNDPYGVFTAVARGSVTEEETGLCNHSSWLSFTYKLSRLSM